MKSEKIQIVSKENDEPLQDLPIRIGHVNMASNGFGTPVFTFDGKKWYYLFGDYPDALTLEEREIFAKEEPFWADFFSQPQ